MTSRWMTTYEQIKEINSGISDNFSLIKEEDINNRQVQEEFLRSKSTFEYIENSLFSLDYNLTPINNLNKILNEVKSLNTEISQFSLNKQQNYLNQLNNRLDTILTYLCPFIINSQHDDNLKLESRINYVSSIQKLHENLVNDIEKTKIEINKIKTDIINQQKVVSDIKNDAEKVAEEYLEKYHQGENNSVETQLNKLKTNINKQNVEIDTLYKNLLTNDNSVKIEIDRFKTLSEENQRHINKIYQESDTKISQLLEYHDKVFGIKTSDSENDIGLKKEIENRKEELEEFKVTQQTKYNELNEQIEKLLPGATSAGLASAYHELRNSFNKPIRNNSIIFFLSLITMVITSIILAIDDYKFTNQLSIFQPVAFFQLLILISFVSIFLYLDYKQNKDLTKKSSLFKIGFLFIFVILASTFIPNIQITFVKFTTIESLISALIFKLPILAPIIWIAIHSSNRRKEAERLQQEYAHKEAMAKSYENFKLQIKNLDTNQGEPLLEKLLSTGIDTIGYNASQTLDKGKNSETPVVSILEQINKLPESVKSLIKMKDSDK